jgi:hypothetical protein
MKLRTQILVFSVVCLLAFAMTPVANADCHAAAIAHVNSLGPLPVLDGTPAVPAGHYANFIPAAPTGPNLNQEGRAERVADILIWDDGATPPCFTVNTDLFRITYNAPITVPNPPTYPAAPGTLAAYNFDVIDSNGLNGLVINASTMTNFGPGGNESVITIDVTQLGTKGNPFASLVGSALRLKNIRVDASTLTAPTSALATVSGTFGALSLVPAVLTVGDVQTTVNPASISLDAGDGEQSSGKTLYDQAEVNWTEHFPNAFREACTTQIPPSTPYCSAVTNDIATSDTSVIWSVSDIPDGVSVIFPPYMTNFAGTLTYTSRAGEVICTGSSTVSTCDVIYDTTLDNPATVDSIVVYTGSGYNVGGPFGNPGVGVDIANPSGWGDVGVAVQFGPSTVCQTTVVSDDCDTTPLTNLPAAAGRIPRYVDSIAASSVVGVDSFGGGGGTRLIASGEWFDVNPIRTVLLYPYVTDLAGFGTGIAIANTGQDCLVPGSPTVTSCAFLQNSGPFDPTIIPLPTTFHSGLLDIFVFPDNAAPFELSSAALATSTMCNPVGCGLDSSGNLHGGNVFSAGLAAILTAAGQQSLIGSFQGYIIVVAEFNYAHGDGVVFNSSGAMAGYGALILGKQSRVGKHGRQAEHLDQ